MIAFVDPEESPDAWRAVTFVGFGPLPGVMKEDGIKGLKREHEWVVQVGFGTSGAGTIWRRRKIIESITIELFSLRKEHFDGLRKFADVVIPKKGAKPPTFAVQHPMFAAHDVDRVSLKSYSLEPVPQRMTKFTLELIEFSPLIKAPTGPADPAKLPGDPVPKTEAEQMLQGLKDQISNFGKK